MRRSLRIVAPLLPLAICLMAGIVAATFLPATLPPLYLWTALAVLTVATWAACRWPSAQSVFIHVCFAALGMALAANHGSKLNTPWPDGTTDYEAVIATEPTTGPKTLAADLLRADDGRRLKAHLQKDDYSRQLQVGDGLHIRSKIRPLSDVRQRGKFDYRRYLEVRGYAGTTYIAGGDWEPTVVSLKKLSRWERAKLRFMRYRHQLLQRYRTAGTEGEAYAVVAALALGDKSALTKELKETYNVSGAAHVLALSGLHLGIIYGLLSLLAVGRWRWLWQLLIVLSIWAFALLVGMSAGVVRSATMISIYSLLSVGGRNPLSVNVLAFTAIAMLMVNPYSLFDVSFQLSFASMAGILILMPLFECGVSMKFLMEHRVMRWLWGMCCVSCAAQIATAPLVAYYFGRFPTYFLLTNLMAIPLVTVILYLALATVAVPWFVCLLTPAVTLLNAGLTFIATRLPLASIDGLHPTVVQTTMAYAIIVAAYYIIRYKLSGSFTK